MASRTFQKTLRGSLARQLASPAVQQRAAYSVARTAVRATAATAARPARAVFAQQVRGVKTIDFAGSKEDVYGEYLFFLLLIPQAPAIGSLEGGSG